MPSLSVGFAQVEERLCILRRRLNLLTLQDAVYVSGTLAVLALTLVVVLALRARAAFFTGAMWTALAAVGAATIAAVQRVRRRWLSAVQVAHLADREAELDDRLATLLDEAPRARTSPLRGILLEQILAAAPRWDVDVLAPRRVPRSVFALAAALAALIVAAFFARPPTAPQAAPAMRPHPSGADTEAGLLRPPTAPKRTEGLGGIDAGDGMQVAGLPGAGAGFARPSSSSAETGPHPSIAPPEQGAEGAQTSRDGLNGTLLGARSSAGRDPGAGPRNERNLLGDEASASSTSPNMAERLQDAIRQAFGAERPDQNGVHDGETGRRDASRQVDANAGRGVGAERRDTTTLRSAHSGTDPLDSARAREDGLNKDASSTGSRPPSAADAVPGAGAAATAGLRTGPAPGELFASQSGAPLGGNGSQSVSIKLGTFTSAAPSQAEPQRQAPLVGDPTVGRASGNASPAPSDEQIPDAVLQKGDIAPEHEALVRRIFTRDE